MSQRIIDAILNGDGGDLPCVLEVEREDMRVRVLAHDCPETAGGDGYLVELYSFSDFRQEWRLAGRVGDFDLHTAIGLLAQAASELYHRRGTGHHPERP
jgi:hypothetical protein